MQQQVTILYKVMWHILTTVQLQMMIHISHESDDFYLENISAQDVPYAFRIIQGGILEASGDVPDGILKSESWNICGRKYCRDHVEVMF